MTDCRLAREYEERAATLVPDETLFSRLLSPLIGASGARWLRRHFGVSRLIGAHFDFEA
jgi:hypothetical protein